MRLQMNAPFGVEFVFLCFFFSARVPVAIPKETIQAMGAYLVTL